MRPWLKAVVLIGWVMQSVQAYTYQDMRILRAGHLLQNPSVLSDPTACQPYRGDRVEQQHVKVNINDIKGLNAVYVRLVSGPCSGTYGWIAQNLLTVRRDSEK